MTVHLLVTEHKSLSCRFPPLSFPESVRLFISIFFHLFSPASSRSYSRSLSLSAFVTESVYVCGARQLLGLCTQPEPHVYTQLALPLSEMTRTTSTDKESSPACSLCSLTQSVGRSVGLCYTMSGGETHYRQTFVSNPRKKKKLHLKIIIF